MFVENFLLPRFLILELLCACHYLEYIHAVDVLTCEARTVFRARKGVYELQEIQEHDDDRYSYKFSPVSSVKGAKGLKNFLEEEESEEESIEDDDLRDDTSIKGAGGLKEFLTEDDIEQSGEEESGIENVLKEGPQCKFSLQGQRWKFPPLLFNSLGLPILPVGNPDNPDMEVKIDHGDKITVFCPGKKVKNSVKDKLTVSCHERDKFLLNDIIIDIDQLGCVGNPSEAEIVADHSGDCGPDNRGQISQIGFVLSEVMYPIITVCHDDIIEETFYTNHTLYGKFLHYKSIYERNSVYFREGRLYFKSISANDAYRQAKQKQIFSALLDDDCSLMDYYNPGDGLYLARGHLAPKADLLYTDWQEASYMYSNVVPQWQRINNGNWRTVEEGVRAAARRRGSTFSVYTGAFDRFQVRNNN